VKARPSPSMIVAITALVFAMTGAGYAAGHLNGDGSAHQAKKKKAKAKPGPAGPAGANGATGAPGAAGTSLPAGFTGHIQGLNTAASSTAFATPSGNSSTSATLSQVGGLSPGRPLTATNLTVNVSTAPITGIRDFELHVGPPLAGDSSTPCEIGPLSTSCSQNFSLPIAPLSEISIESDVNGGAIGNDAEFSWSVAP
jgi:hypothetical protein